jgi:Ca2+-dependent lipid-binding protein
MSNNEFDDIILKEIIPVIREVVNSSHGMKNIKLAHTLHSIRIGIIRTCDLYQDLDILCIRSKYYESNNKKQYYKYMISINELNRIRIHKLEYIVDDSLNPERIGYEDITYM